MSNSFLMVGLEVSWLGEANAKLGVRPGYSSLLKASYYHVTVTLIMSLTFKYPWVVPSWSRMSDIVLKGSSDMYTIFGKYRVMYTIYNIFKARKFDIPRFETKSASGQIQILFRYCDITIYDNRQIMRENEIRYSSVNIAHSCLWSNLVIVSFN